METNQSSLSRFFGGWVFLLNSIGTAWIFLIMILINADVLLRWLLDKPIDGVAEIVAISMVGIVFLQIADAIRVGRLTRSDGFFNKISEKMPKVGAVMDLIFDIFGVLFFAVILTGAVPFFIDAWVNNYFVGTEGIFTFPKWPVRLILVISSATVILVLLVKIFAQIMGRPNPLLSAETANSDEGQE